MSLKQATKKDKISQACWEMTLLVLVCLELAKAPEQREEEHMAIPPLLKPTCASLPFSDRHVLNPKYTISRYQEIMNIALHGKNDLQL